MLRPLVGRRVQGLFHSPVFTPLFGVLFTFPSRYWFAIGLSGVFSLTGWAPLIRAEFLVLRVTQDDTRLSEQVVYRAFTVSGHAFQHVPLCSFLAFIVLLLPRHCLNNTGLGFSVFARHYLRNHFCFLLLRVLRCFSSPRSLPFSGWQASNLPGCPIRISEDQRLFAPPPGFSQLITSFVASESLGIHRLPLLTFFFLALHAPG